MVGHTHEDIDARFAVIWKSMRLQHVLSPKSYAHAISDAFGGAFPVVVKDIWVVPDYTSMLKPYVDKKFGRYAKSEWTQLQFIFEATNKNEHFPLGVKTTYRRYSSTEDVAEIIVDKTVRGGFSELYCKSITYPLAKESEGNSPARPAGMYILKELPDFKDISPCGFKRGGRSEFVETLKQVKLKLPDSAIKDWDEFEQSVPEDDDVQRHLTKFPQHFHLPLKNELFSNSITLASGGLVPSRVSRARTQRRTGKEIIATESVLWSNRGDISHLVTTPTVPAEVMRQS